MKISSLFSFVCCLLPVLSFSQAQLPAPYAGSIKYNIIRTWDAQAPVTDASVLTAKGYQDARQTILYADGLGRPIQTVQRQGSLVTNGTAKDVVMPLLYDNYGRNVFQYLPFVANNTGGNSSITNGAFKYNAFQQDSAFQKNQFPGETFYYSKSIYEHSPLNRVLQTYAPGNSWAGSEANSDSALRRNVGVEQKINTLGDSVWIWKVNGSNFTSNARYAANQLFKLLTIDEHKKKIIEYKNKEGQVVLKKVQLLDSPLPGHYGWLCTYYVYDDLGQLRLVIQPEGVKLIIANENALTGIDSEILDEQCFRYEYDNKGRLIVQKVPGASEVRRIYDARDRIIMQQDGNLRASNKWVYTKYDGQNRPVMTGFYSNATYTTQGAMQSYVDGLNLGMAENYPTGSFPYYTIDQTFPVLADTSSILTVSWFDDYAWTVGFSGFESMDNSLNSLFPSPSTEVWPYAESLTSNTTQVTTMPTGSWDNTSGGLASVLFYDDKGRIIQTRSQNITGGFSVLTNGYSFNGKLLQTSLWHYKGGTNEHASVIIDKYEYDDLWRILTISQRLITTALGGSTYTDEQPIISYEYDALGQMIKKKLGNNPDISGAPLSTLDYTYNIRGWMSSINKGYLSATNNDQYFAMELGYDKNAEYGTFSPQFNGNISGVIWKNESDQQLRKYDFSYDGSNRLMAANFTQYVSGSGSSAVFNTSGGIDFSLSGMSYDANGNILSLNQKGWKLGGSNFIDQLQYTYYGNSNRLKNVIDAVNDTATRLGDFRSSKAYMEALSNSKNNTATDYTYDANGNLNKDRNKDIEDDSYAGVEYNHLNLPVKIRVKDKGTIEYLYDNAGNKLRKIVTEGDSVTTTLYLNGFEYRNDTLLHISQPEGRVRIEQASSNTCPQLDLRHVYDYFLKDHLGNVRMVLTEERLTDCYPAATVEESRLTAEQKIYDIKPGRIISKITTGASESSFEDKLYRTHGGLTNEKTGLAVVLKVMSGDKVAIRGESFYSLPGGHAGSPLTIALTELLASFAGSMPAGLKGISSTADITGISGNPAALNSFVSSNDPATNTAKAAINWILFDEQFKFVAADFDGVLAGGGYKNHTKFISTPVVVSKSGYLYVFVSNESNLPVYFDNLQLSHTHGPIVETNDYYPFGLNMAGIQSKVFNQSNGNKKKYNGIEYEGDMGLNTYDAQLRELDPQIGRWWEIDPKTENMEIWSPYASNYNNPIRYADPLGDEGDECCKGLRDAIIQTGKDIVTFTLSAANALVTNQVGGAGRGDVAMFGDPHDIAIAKAGQITGDGLTVLGSVLSTGGAIVAEAGSSGAATAVVVPLMIQQWGVATPTAVRNLLNSGNSNQDQSSKGSRNPTVKERIDKGKAAHKEFKEKVEKKDGWQAEPTITDPKTGEKMRPDALTPSGNPVELKPNTQSGKSKGEKQIKKYERATGKPGKVIYYDPKNIVL